MTESQYWTRIAIWVFLFLGLPFIVMPIVKALWTSGVGHIGYASIAAMWIKLFVALGICWTAFGRLREIGWSPLWLIFLYCTLSSGFMATGATPFAGYHFSLFSGWAIFVSAGFLCFIGIHEGEVYGFSEQVRVFKIAKITAIILACMFTLWTYKAGILNLRGIPGLNAFFMELSMNLPSPRRVLQLPAYWLGMKSITTYRLILVALFLAALAAQRYFSDDNIIEDDDFGYTPQNTSSQPQGFTPALSQKPQSFGRR